MAGSDPVTRALTQDEFLTAVAPTMYRQPQALARAFGPRRKADIAALIYGYCESDLGAPPLRVLFFGVSIGGVLGIRLTDGREVAIKACHDADLRHLKRAYDLQEELRRKGIPCAELLRPPQEITPQLSIVTHRLFAPGSQARCTQAVRGTMAEDYRRITVAAEPCDPAGLAILGLVPRIDLFDHFPGLWEELEDLHLHDRKVIAHTDWKIRNLLFYNERISAVFDFDALHVVGELLSVASTALNFMRARGPITITLYPEETYGFLAAYERIRKQEFSVDEIRQIRLWSLMT